MRSMLLSLVLALFVAPLSSLAQITAQNAWIRPGTDETTDWMGNPVSNVVDRKDAIIAYSFDESVASNTYIGFTIATTLATCSLNDDVRAASGTAVVEIRSCPTGSTTKDANHCSQVADTFSAPDSNAFMRGEYAFVVTTDPTAGDDAVFSCRGVED